MTQSDHIAITKIFTQADFNAFAALSGDDNPIHVDPEFSARTKFGRTVSHGMLLYTVLRGLVGRLAPGKQQMSQELMFRSPAYADDPIRFEARRVLNGDDSVKIDVLATRLSDGVLVCEGSCVIGVEGDIE